MSQFLCRELQYDCDCVIMFSGVAFIFTILIISIMGLYLIDGQALELVAILGIILCEENFIPCRRCEVTST